MNKEIIYKIKTNPMIYQILREESYHYKYLYRDNNYIKYLEKYAKEKYKQRPIDKIEKLKNTINLVQTFMSVIN